MADPSTEISRPNLVSSIINSAANGPHDHMMMHHPMVFHFGVEETILFGFWKIDSAFGIIASSLVIVLMCFLMEFIRWVRNYRNAQNSQGERGSLESNRKKCDLGLVLDVVLHAVQLTVAYSLMLIFMIFNVWICMAIVFGEVFARLALTLLFPQFNFATTENCCG